MPPNPLMPDLLFEVSWEVCNKVGGIHTVITSKAPTLVHALADDYVTIGPWLLPQSDRQPSFVDEPGHETFVAACREAGVPVRVGRWEIPGRPRCLLVSFAGLYESKDGVLAGLWERNAVDSLRGGWDYIEPVIFGQAAGIAIDLWCRARSGEAGPRIVAHFHEWLSGAGLLYLADHAPGVATVFTTHATVVGRSVAGNGGSLPLLLEGASPAALAQQLGVPAKHSLECATARGADVFTTVSGITADEAELLFDRRPDPVTPNGIDLAVIDALAGPEDPSLVRQRLLELAAQLLGEPADDALLLATSGRYEFHNKGYDVLLDAAAILDRRPGPRLLLLMLVPAGHSGLRPDLQARRQGETPATAGPPGLATHVLHDPDSDPIAARCAALGLGNRPGARIKVIHVPIYLSEIDGLWNLPYEAVLRAVDLSCFVSDYEPWGYTPQESLALGVPTITSDHAGFGRWCAESGLRAPESVTILSREGADHVALVEALADCIDRMAATAMARSTEGAVARTAFRATNRAIAARTDWGVFFSHYQVAYATAAGRAQSRSLTSASRLRPTVPLLVRPQEAGRSPRLARFDVAASLPAPLQGLQRLAQNLWWTWDPAAGALFSALDPELWRSCGENPVLLLRRLPLEALRARATDVDFVATLNQVLARLDAHLGQPAEASVDQGRAPDGRIAYFCAEFGLHPSLPIYSGGLGVLAGDCLKAASDLALPVVGVGLFYRGGYLHQGITATGEQVARELSLDPGDLPLEPILGPDGQPLQIDIEMPGIRLALRAWLLLVGRVPLFLLDSDLPANPPEARAITRQLYGGNHELRLKQEIVLGKGGVRLLKCLRIRPSVFHLNEGHAALAVLERIANLMHDCGQSYETALTVVRASTVFTTHTPVPAGHDRFVEDLVRRHFGNAPDWLGLPWERFLALGQSVEAPGMFNMSGLAFRSAAICNAVSDLHRDVSQSLLHSFTPARLENEVPVIGVTNGVHLASWAAPEICRLLGVVDRPVTGRDFSEGARRVDANALWAARGALRAQLLAGMRRQLTDSFRRRHDSPALLRRILEGLNENAQIIGFARRFAPYKRAQLLLAEPRRLVDLLSNAARPLRIVVAGKAHPHDHHGQELLQRLAQAAREPELAGRLIFLEDHDMSLARLLVQGADVWLNTPIHRLEASGTSGMKAAANGGLNLSILDGWWAEGYDGGNGWAIGGQRVYGEESQSLQDELDGAELFRLLEEEVVPTFFARDEAGLPMAWLDRIRCSLATIPAAFDAARMMKDYDERAYRPLAAAHAALAAEGYVEAERRAARAIRLRAAFKDVAIRELQIGALVGRQAGDLIPVRSTVHLGSLEPDDVVVEFVLGRPAGPTRLDDMRIFALRPLSGPPGGACRFEAEVPVEQVGSFAYGLRVRARDHGMLDDLVLWA